MRRSIKLVGGAVFALALGAAAYLYSKNAGGKGDGLTTVTIARGTLTEKALATGQIVPDQEIQVKSQISGIVARCFVEVGERVEVGQPLFTITPDPTPLELAEAERGVELAQVGYDRAQQDLERSRSLWSGGVIAKDQFDAREKDFDRARISLVSLAGKVARPRLETLAGVVRDVLGDAIAAGGSMLRDFANAEGGQGYFQHRFDVYGREHEPCRTEGCRGVVKRIVQGGRSTFFCPLCQKG